MHLLFAVQRPLFSFGFSLPFQRGHHVQKYLLICFANTTHMREFSRINEPMFQLHVTTQSQFSPFSAKSHIVCFDFLSLLLKNDDTNQNCAQFLSTVFRILPLNFFEMILIDMFLIDMFFLLLKAIFQLRKTSFF